MNNILHQLTEFLIPCIQLVPKCVGRLLFPLKQSWSWSGWLKPTTCRNSRHGKEMGLGPCQEQVALYSPGLYIYIYNSMLMGLYQFYVHPPFWGWQSPPFWGVTANQLISFSSYTCLKNHPSWCRNSSINRKISLVICWCFVYLCFFSICLWWVVIFWYGKSPFEEYFR